MAGAGYKLFNTGDVLTAAQVNTYLQEQVVMRFATTAARTTALAGVLAEGMVSYIDATDTLEVYNGSAWVSAIGDITEVQAGTGISVASGTGPIPVVTNTVATTFDAKADLVVGTGADTFSKLTVGSDHSILQALASESTGLRYLDNWTSYTPTLTNMTLGNGTVTAKYFRTGKTVNVYFRFVLGSTSSVSTFPYFSLPFSSATSSVGWLQILDSGTATFYGIVQSSGGNGLLGIAATNGTYMTAPDITATVPMTWTTNDAMTATLTYEAA